MKFSAFFTLSTLSLGGFLCASALAAPATLTRSSDLKAAPKLDAETLTTLSERTQVELIGSSAGWSQVQTRDGKTGWVRLLNVKVSTGGGNVAGLDKLGNVLRTGDTGNTATTGVKGLNAGDIQNGSPDPAELAKLDRFNVSEDAARRFADRARIYARNVDYLGK